MKRRIRGLAIAAIFLAAFLTIGLVARQVGLLDRYFLFFPDREILENPADYGLEYEDVFFEASDGVRLNGWFVPGESDVTLVWFHGNAGNIGNRAHNIALLHERVGVKIFIFDYRGYGRSEGGVTEEGTYLDAEAALAYLRSRGDVNPDRLVLFGRSLGAAVAVEMAARHQFHAVMLETPFTSIADMAKHLYPVLAAVFPVGAVVKSKYDALSRIKDVRAPILVLHGDADDIVPLDIGRRLYEAASEPKRFYTIQGAGHNDTYLAGGEPYFDELRRFIESPSGSIDAE